MADKKANPKLPLHKYIATGGLPKNKPKAVINSKKK